MNDPTKKDLSAVGAEDKPEQVKKSSRTFSPLFILPEKQAYEESRNSEALGEVYIFILSLKRGKP
jgi:hypothetical protein